MGVWRREKRKKMSEPTRSYRDLIAWQKAMDLIPPVYALVKKLPTEERFELGSQLRRAIVSVPANIAEGQARQSSNEFRQYLSIARGSLAEVDTLVEIGVRLKYWEPEQLISLSAQIIELRRIIQGLIRSQS